MKVIIKTIETTHFRILFDSRYKISCLSDTADGENGIDDTEANGDFQIVMEVWIEPQCGYVQSGEMKKSAYMHLLKYQELPEAVST